MDSKVNYQFLYGGLVALQERIDALEANQRNAESGTTGCSAAGGGIEHGKPARSAGREPCLDDLLSFIAKSIAESEKSLEALPEHSSALVSFHERRISEAQFAMLVVQDFIEARRRSTGCAEPPAG